MTSRATSRDGVCRCILQVLPEMSKSRGRQTKRRAIAPALISDLDRAEEDEDSVTPTSSLSPCTAKASANSVIIEEISSTHRYSKHEFMENFGSTVVYYILSHEWGKAKLNKPGVKEDIKAAIWKYLQDCYPNETDEIKIDLTALVVDCEETDLKVAIKHVQFARTLTRIHWLLLCPRDEDKGGYYVVHCAVTIILVRTCLHPLWFHM